MSENSENDELSQEPLPSEGSQQQIYSVPLRVKRLKPKQEDIQYRESPWEMNEKGIEEKNNILYALYFLSRINYFSSFLLLFGLCHFCLGCCRCHHFCCF